MGNRGPAAKAKKTAVSYPRGTPKPPAWLSADARTEYIRAARIMGDAVMLADMAALATYAQAYADLARLSLEIRAEGEVKTFSNGLVAANKKCALRDRAQRAMHIAGAKLGFSPVDRARGPAGSSAPAADAFSEFIK